VLNQSETIKQTNKQTSRSQQENQQNPATTKDKRQEEGAY
jgi:hypothetical protein